MPRKYWLDLFTGKTWEEFVKAGAKVSGFREHRRNIAGKISIGDYLICYVTGISRVIGILEVNSKVYNDTSPIWEDDPFSVRFKVDLIYKLEPKTAVPILDLRDKLSIFENLKSPHAWSGFFRGSPNLFKKERDGEIIVDAVKAAAANPVERDFDERKYSAALPKIYESKVGVVTVPEEVNETVETEKYQSAEVSHEEIQYLLLKLGSDLGLNVWVARNDRNKAFNGAAFKDMPKLLKELPNQFDPATNKTIELIDVLWLQGNAILAAFEVEHTTAIYSGLLRMSDLVSMQPNIKIDLYLVAPDERRDKVFNEINRPTFAKLKPPLTKLCKFIPYSNLKAEVQHLGDKVRYMKPEFIQDMAETFEPEEL